MRLKDKIAVITGGSRGIGFATADRFLKEGATVILTASSQASADRAATRLREKYPEAAVSGISPDLASLDSVKEAFQKVIAEYGRIDILVNNAGVLGASMPNAREEEFDRVIDTNLKGVFFLSQLFGKYMKENKITGNILNVGSSSCLRPAISAYTLSKWGIRGLTLGLAKSLAPYGITVNGIAPGPTATPMLLKDDLNNITNNGNPIGRYALPEEIANMAVILVSPMGQTIVGDMVYMTGGAALITFEDSDYTF